MKGFNKFKPRRRDFRGSDRRDSESSDGFDSERPKRRDFERADRGDFRRGRERGFSSSRKRDFGRKFMVEVTCDKCGQRCEVPFRPTSGKPVYCKNCFKKEDNSGQREKSNQFEREFEQINQKLDKIISALEI